MLTAKEKGSGAPHAGALNDHQTKHLQSSNGRHADQAFGVPLTAFQQLEQGFAAKGWRLYPLHGEALLATIPAWGMSRRTLSGIAEARSLLRKIGGAA